MDKHVIKPIAFVRSDYNQKFGIPRQAGLAGELEQAVVIEPEFRNLDALRGLEGFSHIWLIWGFSRNALDMEADRVKWSPTVRPPRLGGSERKGVWATRSPYRPNSLGLSCVRLERIELDGRPIMQKDQQDLTMRGGMVSGELAVIVSGADIMNGTPVYDIKPYIPYADCHPEAAGGFTDETEMPLLKVVFPEELLARIPEDKRAGLIRVLELDPRGAYEKQPGYTYGLSFGDHDIKFVVNGDTLTVTDISDTY